MIDRGKRSKTLSEVKLVENTEKLPESIKSSKFVSHRPRMSGKFDSRKDSHSRKLEQRPRIFVKLSFRELCGSKLSDLHPFDNMAIIHCVKIRLKTER